MSFNWLKFGRRKKAALAPLPPLPETIERTAVSEELAHNLLDIMQGHCEGQPAGYKVTHTMSDEQMSTTNVAPHELTLSLMMLAGEYGLRLDVLAFGTINCTKL